KQVKADHKTVGAVRKAKEATGELSPVEKRVGADGKARKQPAKKKTTAKPVPRQIQRELEAKQAHIDDLEAAREHDGLAEELQAAKIKITGLESEIEELKAENASLREQLKAAQATSAAKPEKKRGRPKGSKNRPKPPVEPAAADVATPEPVLG